MENRFEQSRISQLLSTYAPDDPPSLGLDFGDYLSLLWRLDCSAGQLHQARYYRRCVQALGAALMLTSHPFARLVETTAPGELYRQLPNLPYRSGVLLVDAHDRKAAIAQLIQLREDTLRIGTYQAGWNGRWPGSGIVETELRERVFAVLFTALQGQFSNFGRLLLVVDIVLTNLLIGFDAPEEVPLALLVKDYGYPDPASARVRREFAGG